MMTDLYTYVSAIFDKYQVMASVAVPSLIAAWGLALLDRAKRLAGQRAERLILIGRALVAITAIFVIGFLAWRDEHSARIIAEDNYRVLLSKSSQNLAAVSRLEVSINERDSKSGLFKVRFFNNGQISAQLQGALFLIVFSEQPEIVGDARSRMVDLETKVGNLLKVRGNEIEILPNHWWQLPVPAVNNAGSTLTDEDFTKFKEGKIYINLYVVALFRDDALSESNEFRKVRFCTAYLSNFSETYSCPGENRTVLFRP